MKTEPTNQDTPTPATTPVPAPAPAPEDRFKDDPKYKAMANQLSELQKEKEDRQSAQAQAAQEAEQKRLKDAGLFDEAAALHKKTVEDLESKHAAELQNRDITTELLKAGFSNSKFLRGSVVDYDPKNDGTIDEYVKALAADEANKEFLKGLGIPSRDPRDPPGKTPNVQSVSSLTGQQIRTLKNSDNPEERLKGHEALRKYVDTHEGAFPPGYE